MDKIKWVVVLMCSFLCSCSEQKQALSPPSFYYWQLNNTTDLPLAKLTQLQTQHYYIKFMDIDWDATKGLPIPKASLQLSSNLKPLFEKQFSPCFYIQNQVFLNADSATSTDLAQKIAEVLKHKLQQIATTYLLPDVQNKLQEIQIDCDWTAKSKEQYFFFLQELKKQLAPKTISVTLRLYPYKYPNLMGVPPADKAILMCYNMDQIKQFATKNSIYSLDVLKQYVNTTNTYPLPIEVALPIYGWYVWFRNQQYKGILYAPEFEQLKTSAIAHQPNHFLVDQEFASTSRLFRYGDVIRKEFPDAAELIEGAKWLQGKIPHINKFHYFYIDSTNLTNYEKTIHHIQHP